MPAEVGNLFLLLYAIFAAQKSKIRNRNILHRNGNKKLQNQVILQLFGAGYGSRTRLFGLGSRRTTDVLTLHIQFYRVIFSVAIFSFLKSCISRYLCVLPTTVLVLLSRTAWTWIITSYLRAFIYYWLRF